MAVTTYLECGECGVGLSAHAMCVTRLECFTHQYCRALLALPLEVQDALVRHIECDAEGKVTIAKDAPNIADLWRVAFPWAGMVVSTNSMSEKARADQLVQIRKELLG